MCELCSEDRVIRQAAAIALSRTAERLEELAKKYRTLAAGEVCRHSEEVKSTSSTARAVVRDLVETWV